MSVRGKSLAKNEKKDLKADGMFRCFSRKMFYISLYCKDCYADFKSLTEYGKNNSLDDTVYTGVAAVIENDIQSKGYGFYYNKQANNQLDGENISLINFKA